MAYLLSLIFAAIGLFVSGYIGYTKQKKQKLVCIVGEDCDLVVRSKWSTVLGVPIEFPGMLYYFFAGLASILFLQNIETVWGIEIKTVFFIAAGLSALFSLFLVYIQGFKIREWCEYCLVSAGMSILIFITYFLV